MNGSCAHRGATSHDYKVLSTLYIALNLYYLYYHSNLNIQMKFNLLSTHLELSLDTQTQHKYLDLISMYVIISFLIIDHTYYTCTMVMHPLQPKFYWQNAGYEKGMSHHKVDQ